MWWKVWWPRAKTAWLLFGELVMLLWAVALWDSYRPKITISPGGTLNPKTPFATYFIMQNQGALPISNIKYLSHLTVVSPQGSILGATNISQVETREQNVSVIPQMKSLECYSLSVHYQQVQVNTHFTGATNQIIATNEFIIGTLLLSFDVSYEPKFFKKRTETLYFNGVMDVDGNWQWLPTAHQSLLAQTIDTNLLQQVQMNPAPAAIPTNGGTQVHTNQTKPK